MSTKPRWVTIRATVSAEDSLRAYKQAKALLPPDVEPTLDDVNARMPRPARPPRPPRQRKGGPPLGDGLTRDTILDKVIELWDASGPFPIQPFVAEKLGVSDRRIRQVEGKRGWAGIRADAEALRAER